MYMFIIYLHKTWPFQLFLKLKIAKIAKSFQCFVYCERAFSVGYKLYSSTVNCLGHYVPSGEGMKREEWGAQAVGPQRTLFAKQLATFLCGQ